MTQSNPSPKITYSLEDILMRIEQKIDKLDEKFESKLNKLDEKIDKLDEKFESKLNKLDEKFETKLNNLSEQLTQTNLILTKVETKQEEVENNIREIKGSQQAQIWTLIGILITAVGGFIVAVGRFVFSGNPRIAFWQLMY